jgi:hypothetical protein
MEDESKKISKADESSKLFIMDMLGSEHTHGIDIDSIYFIKEKKWLMFEFLKSDKKDPFDCGPNLYPWNWKKFVTLFEISKRLDAYLWLVNYSLEDAWKNNIKLQKVSKIDYDLLKKALNSYRGYLKGYLPYVISTDTTMDLVAFKKLFNDINNSAIMSVDL